LLFHNVNHLLTFALYIRRHVQNPGARIQTRERHMKGAEWAAQRRRLGYSQQTLMRELGVGSRQTISTWENSEEVPRLAVLALYAIEHCPECRRSLGSGVSLTEERKYFNKMRNGGPDG
jgi:DNA-binding transcriptional regulator YiaG